MLDEPATDKPDDAAPEAAAAPKMERRFDAIKVRGLKPYRRESDGALLFEGVITREGILEYTRADGSVRRELVTRQAVMDTARTMPRSAVTLQHPPEGMITPKTYQARSVGDVDGEASVEEDAQGAFVRVKLAVRREDAIRAIEEDGVSELSAGYMAVIDQTPGVHPRYGSFDVSQVGRVCNHSAIVPDGRAGETVSLLRADSSDAASVAVASFAPVSLQAPSGATTPSPEDGTMKQSLILLLSALGVERLDSEDAALADGLVAAKSLRRDADKGAEAEETATKLDEMKKNLDELQKKYDEAVAEAEALKEAEEERADAAERESLRELAKTLKLDADTAGRAGLRLDGSDTKALRLAIVQSRVPKAAADWADARLDGVIEVLRADAAIAAKGDGQARADFGTSRTAGVRADAADPKSEFASPTLDAITTGGAK